MTQIPSDGMRDSQKRISNKEYTTIYEARAHLNIITPSQILRVFRRNIVEQFENEFDFNYYIDHSTGLQINDTQIKIFSILRIGKRIIKRIRIGIINCDLHSKIPGNPNLYGIIKLTEYGKISVEDKWSWKLVGFSTADMITNKYNIQQYELPKSSRQNNNFQRQLFRPYIDDNLIENTKWKFIPQNKGTRKDFEISQISVELDQELWIEILKHSLKNDDLPFIPIVVNKNNHHFIEWIKIICIKSQNVYIGVGFKYEINKNLIYKYCHGETEQNLPNDVLDIIIDYCQNVVISRIEVDLDYISCAHCLLGSQSMFVISNNELSQFRPFVTNLIFE